MGSNIQQALTHENCFFCDPCKPLLLMQLAGPAKTTQTKQNSKRHLARTNRLWRFLLKGSLEHPFQSKLSKD